MTNVVVGFGKRHLRHCSHDSDVKIVYQAHACRVEECPAKLQLIINRNGMSEIAALRRR